MQPIATRPRPSRRRVPGDAAGAADDGRSESTVDAGSRWTARPWVPPTERADAGKAARKQTPRTTHAAFQPAPDRDPDRDPRDQESDRLPELLPLRHQRMAESAFAYYRGTPAVMAFDLASTPRTNILVQASGDAHLCNFGLFASPERTLVFDANDFDETLPGPWEWDVKRLATSVIIAGRSNGFSAAVNRDATMAGTRSYRQWMARYAGMRLIDVLYASITRPTSARRRRRAVGSRGDSVQSTARVSRRSFPRRASATACARSSRSRAWWTAAVSSSTTRPWSPTSTWPRSAVRLPWRRSSPTTARPCRRTGARISSATASSTSRSRSSASAASGPVASSWSSRGATRTTR